MSVQSNLLYLSCAGLLLAALPLMAKPLPTKAVDDTVTIENSGSTNTTGYQIVVDPKGQASYRVTGAQPSAQNDLSKAHAQAIPKELAAKFFKDLSAAGPLSALPVRHGMRSASFGTRTSILYKGQQSPDLTFGGNENANALKADITEIIQTLHVSNTPRRPILLPGTAGIPQTEK